MTREDIIRNLKYTMEKHKNDNVNTFDTNISVMCKDILDYLEQEPSGDLISRSELIENFRKCYSGHLGMENSDACMTFHGICNVINNTNTAYDVDKVVEELEEAKHEICLSDEDLEHYQNGIDNAIEIVKQGGVRNKVVK